MAIKIDLEKAYDRIRWDFLKDTLETVGYCRMDILLLNSYQLEGCDNVIQYLHDLVLFCKAELEQARIVKEILTEFSYFSGHKVNNQKSQIYFSAMVDNTVANEKSEYLGVTRTDDLGKKMSCGSRYSSQNIKLMRIVHRTLKEDAAVLLGNLFRSSLSRRVGDGRRLRFWTNHWIKELGPLSNYCTNARPIFQDATVYAMVTLEGEWNWEYFRNSSPKGSIHPPKDDVREDQIAWRLTDNGKCTVASGYSKFAYGDWPLRDQKLIWKLHVPQRVRQFFWLLLHNRLLSNSKRCRRGMVDSQFCNLCGNGFKHLCMR
ncbi:reverse transcriptase [Gossypium australe]|uniref:Reverse transcriptase n=1 Tax=Gossypium australe TaxID=47621 RepID=A0A5B6VWC5_9ROSI|nr:reverse transcriptase [Gossypium australe]